MGFHIKCHCKDTCLESGYFEDGYDNSKQITLKVIGDNLVEIKCWTCGESITVLDGGI